MSRTLNKSIKKHILDPANCHCTYRVITTESSAVARCNQSDIVRAFINWQQFKPTALEPHHYKINLKLTLGDLRFQDKIYVTDTDDIVDAKITALFVLMDNAWNT